MDLFLYYFSYWIMRNLFQNTFNSQDKAINQNALYLPKPR